MTAPVTVAGAILASIGAHGPRTALVAVDGTETTYAALGEKIAAAVGVLRSLGCKAGDRVAIWLSNRPEWPAYQFACALLGAVVVPLNLRYRGSEILYVLEKSGAHVLIAQERFLTNPLMDRLREVAGGKIGSGTSAAIAALPNLACVLLIEGAAEPGTLSLSDTAATPATMAELDALAAARRPEDPMWLFWTSGTTNHPKGVLLDQYSVNNVWNWTTLARFDRDDRVLATFPVFYVAGNFWCLLGPLLHGAAAVLGQMFTPAEVMELCRRERITVLCGVPSMLRQFISNPAYDASAFRHVRKGWFGGGNITPEEVAAIRAAIGFDFLVQVYGMTELLGFAMSTHPDDPDDIVANTCGTPLPGFEFRLVQPDTPLEVAPGEAGELVVKGRRLIEYSAMPEAEQARFYDADGWFRTGDLLRQRSDGRYQFVGRIKDLIKVSGENVAAAEIEDLLRGHPAVREVAVLGVPDAQRGEVPIAFVETAPDSALRNTELAEWCRKRVAPFKVPREFHTVAAADWPRTPSGKIAKWRLAETV